MNGLTENIEYKNWLVEIKSKIKSSQIKASISVNAELIKLHWDIGAMIVQKQESAKWGSGLLEQMAKDLKVEFPSVGGFSRSNLYSMRQFYIFYREYVLVVHQLGGETKNETDKKIIKQYKKIIHQLGGQIESSNSLNILTLIPWRHHVLILQNTKSVEQALFYVAETIKNNWSRAVLEYQIETDLYSRQGKAISNFELTLPKEDSDLAKQLLKDPYNFDFLTLSEKAKEKDLEEKLIANITSFLLELGKGFAYMGRQFPLKVGEKEFRTDLLFYHTKLKAYVVVELKMKEFEPEFIGKLNFYVSAINTLVKNDDDKPTIGILLCKNKDNFVVDFSLKDINKPIGVSEFTYRELPNEIKNSLPSDKEFKNQLSKLDDEN